MEGLHDLLLPEDLGRDFTVEESRRQYDEEGGWEYAWQPVERVHAAMADAGTRELLLAQQVQYSITHGVYHPGHTVAKTGQRLRFMDDSGRERFLYVEGIDNPGGLGLWTIYYCEERGDESAG